MLIAIPHERLTPLFTSHIINRLKKKTNLFDYQLEAEYANDILSGKIKVWGVDNLVILGTTRVHKTGLMTLSLDTVIIEGSFGGSFQDVLNEISEGAKASGYDRIIISGRKSWGRVLDVTHDCSTFYKEI